MHKDQTLATSHPGAVAAIRQVTATTKVGVCRGKLHRAHLEALAAVSIRALVDPFNEVRVDDGLNVRPRQGQNVAQALVPGMELPQAARVLVQALRQREQQPPSAVPAVPTEASSASKTHEAVKRHGNLL